MEDQEVRELIAFKLSYIDLLGSMSSPISIPDPECCLITLVSSRKKTSLELKMPFISLASRHQKLFFLAQLY